MRGRAIPIGGGSQAIYGQTLIRSVSPPLPYDCLEKMEVVEAQSMGLEVVAPTGVEALPPMSAEIIQKVLDFLSGLEETKATSMISTFHALVVHLTFAMALRIDKALGINSFPYFLRLVMAGMKEELSKKFLKMKPTTF